MTERAGLGTSQSGDGEKSFEINVREAPGRQNFLSFLFRRARADTWLPSRASGGTGTSGRLSPWAGWVLAPRSAPRSHSSPPKWRPRPRGPGRPSAPASRFPRAASPFPAGHERLTHSRRSSATRQALRKLHFPIRSSRRTRRLAVPPSLPPALG